MIDEPFGFLVALALVAETTRVVVLPLLAGVAVVAVLLELRES